MNDVDWLEEFTEEAARRMLRQEPDWDEGVEMHPVVVKSVQRFQVGEDGDGANLIEKAGGGAYGAAVKLFIAEEQNHARMLARLLEAAGAETIKSHWSDSVFAWLRRALGLKLELLVLMVAEVVALAYYRILRDGSADRITTEVAARLLADERRHVPFHMSRLGDLSPFTRAAWQVLFLGAVLVVAVDHGSALRVLGVSRRGFVREAMTEFTAATTLPAVTNRVAAGSTT
ncbi:ferritin-like domain-containing protein [Actinokineospora diospyrosa]|uniref:Ferritin-like domain-containing protein n=1 Tax=Actinokineospora diospyrosa TaxID=103728 RepID=A0ABT1I4L7_9PSEU|nr:ferritin-like domain-containing protein [Actinokineospora diospyrosa]MCP2267582.1 hypothetical protein [Actinokineospora diospyrosa]